MIAVTGANGQLGQLVIKSLLNKTKAQNILALVRNPEQSATLRALGVQVKQADYNQPQTLETALADVDTLLLISGSEIGQRVSQHQAVIAAAEKTGVKTLIYTSLLKAETSPMQLAVEHKVTENAIQNSSLDWVILRNAWYIENHTQGLSGILQNKAVIGSSGQGKFSAAARADYAEAAAVILTDPKPHLNKVYELAGDTAYTLAEFAAEISKQTGQNISYQHMPPDAFSKVLQDIGLPQGFADILAESDMQAEKGWLFDNNLTLRQLICRPTMSLAELVKQALSIE